MKRKAILQIGTEKTGSTTLQGFLAANRGRLKDRGFHYPRFCGDLNHTGLAAYAMDADREDDLKFNFGIRYPADVPGMRQRLHELAMDELDCELTAIFCSEHCHSRLTSKAEVRRLYDFLRCHFDDIRVSVYLRRQDEVAVSLYSTVLKSGGSPASILPMPKEDDPYFNYDMFLDTWESVFGSEAVSVRLYEKDMLVGGDVVEDFVASWNLGPIGEFSKVAKLNGAISQPAQEFLRLANPYLNPIDDKPPEELRGPIVAVLERRCNGAGKLPGRSEARELYDTFRRTNARVASRYFPDRPTLFSENFDRYPERATFVSVNAEEIAEVAAVVLVERHRRIEQLKAEIAIRDAAIAWGREEPEKAVAILRNALNRLPRHAGLNRSLGEYMLRTSRSEESLLAAEAACAAAPKDWELWHFLGVVHAARGEHGAAAAAQRKALELEPGHQPCLRALNNALTELRLIAAEVTPH